MPEIPAFLRRRVQVEWVRDAADLVKPARGKTAAPQAARYRTAACTHAVQGQHGLRLRPRLRHDRPGPADQLLDCHRPGTSGSARPSTSPAPFPPGMRGAHCSCARTTGPSFSVTAFSIGSQRAASAPHWTPRHTLAEQRGRASAANSETSARREVASVGPPSCGRHLVIAPARQNAARLHSSLEGLPLHEPKQQHPPIHSSRFFRSCRAEMPWPVKST